jgi:iron-sulfur cluster assembly protein
MNSTTLNTVTNSAIADTQAPPSGGGGGVGIGAENSIFISDKAKTKVLQLMEEAGVAGDDSHFLRVGVVGGGCSGLSYKMDFDNEVKPMDQVFEDKGIKIVCDLKSFLYLVNTELEFSDGLNGKGFYFNNPNASRSCGCGESFAV